MLLEFGADPKRVDTEALFDTYNSQLFERFWALGVDLTSGHGIAYALADHTSNKPLFGFVKRHLADTPGFQTELDIALAYHAGEGNEKGALLCLWAGADPHTKVQNMRYWSLGASRSDGEEDDEEGPVDVRSHRRGPCSLATLRSSVREWTLLRSVAKPYSISRPSPPGRGGQRISGLPPSC